MDSTSFNYVRAFRQRARLHEGELGFLISQGSHTAITRIEGGARRPNFEGALSLQVLFGQAPRQLFPGYFEVVEDTVMRRIAQLLKSLETRTDPASLAKRAFLEEVARADRDGGL
jgi:hypothetical protein